MDPRKSKTRGGLLLYRKKDGKLTSTWLGLILWWLLIYTIFWWLLAYIIHKILRGMLQS